MSAGVNTQRKRRDQRKRNFSPEERAIIVAWIVENDKYLHGAFSHQTSRARKKEILTELSLQVSAVGNATRSTLDIQK